MSGKMGYIPSVADLELPEPGTHLRPGVGILFVNPDFKEIKGTEEEQLLLEMQLLCYEVRRRMRALTDRASRSRLPLHRFSEYDEVWQAATVALSRSDLTEADFERLLLASEAARIRRLCGLEADPPQTDADPTPSEPCPSDS